MHRSLYRRSLGCRVILRIDVEFVSLNSNRVGDFPGNIIVDENSERYRHRFLRGECGNGARKYPR